MIPEYFEEIIRNKKFDRSLQGYNSNQVDRYLQKITAYYWDVCKEKKELEKKIDQYEKQDALLRKALIRLEETSQEMKEKTLIEANKIKQQTKIETEQIRQDSLKEAELIKTQAIEEGEKYIENLIHIRQIYEEQTRKLFGNFYFNVRSKINSLQDELSNELEDYTKILESAILCNKQIKQANKEVNIQDTMIDYWKIKEEELLVGYEIKKDIKDSTGKVVVSKSTVVTPEMIDLLIEKELYGELFNAIGDEVNAYCK